MHILPSTTFAGLKEKYYASGSSSIGHFYAVGFSEWVFRVIFYCRQFQLFQLELILRETSNIKTITLNHHFFWLPFCPQGFFFHFFRFHLEFVSFVSFCLFFSQYIRCDYLQQLHRRTNGILSRSISTGRKKVWFVNKCKRL